MSWEVIGFWIRGGLALIGAFYVPGWLLARQVKPLAGYRYVLAVVAGMVMWTITALIGGYLENRWLTYVYLIGALVMFVVLEFFQIKQMLSKGWKWPRVDGISFAILAIGTLVMLSATWISPTKTDTGELYCCRGVPDLIYHTALSYEAAQKIPPDEPGMAGTETKNYHYWANILVGETYRVFGGKAIDWSGKFFPLIWSLLIGLGVMATSRVLKLPVVTQRWWLIIIFFFGDGLYWLRWILGQGFNFDLLILDNGAVLMAGLPRGWSMVVVVWLFALLAVLTAAKKWVNPVHTGLTGMMVASLAGIKFYTFVPAGVMFLIMMLYQFRLTKKWRYPLMWLFTMGLAGGIYALASDMGANRLYLIRPYLIENFINNPDLGLAGWEFRRQVYALHQNWPWLVIYAAGFALLYLVSAFGVMLIGLPALWWTRKRLPLPWGLGLTAVVGVSLVLGLFTYQEIGGLNTVQFLVALPYWLALPVSLWLTGLKAKYKPAAVMLVWLGFGILLVPRTVKQGVENMGWFPGRQEEMLTTDFLAAAQDIRKDPGQAPVVLYPEWAQKETFMAARYLTGKPVYLAGYYGVLVDHQVAEADAKMKYVQHFSEGKGEDLVKDIRAKAFYYITPAGKFVNIDRIGLPYQELGRYGEVELYKF